ncbi:hypothetical protein GCM10009677_52970 [Sphaerisporangium rubeum]|uniref:Uncharacterized protein n=1 Tax=Sphaerisporangium rubeum TaxID=321317 RepID=A0A7X0IIL8_9ACTN|nr:hypothetical protein [Sphaerisporangium rubeum]MBB6475598.1 hypothetical protein [Sphaerisporangium rubeum]
MLGIAFVVVVGAIVFAVVARRMSEKRTRAPITVEEKVPEFQVVALGLQGSGKTLLLASMYHCLRVPAGQSYFLHAPHRDVLQLNQWYAEMADTGTADLWPRGTAKGETRHFLFTVKTTVGGTPRPMFHLKYLEYAGELLSDPQTEGSGKQDELFAHIRAADALLGVIDGYRLRQHLDGHPAGAAHLERTLNALLPAMIEASCPISFVITKWDLLADRYPDETRRLSVVHDLLMSNAHFRTLIHLHSATRIMRLVPVSAVGHGFATIDHDGDIVKTAATAVHPTNVDVPLSAVVPDLFDQVEARLTRENLAALDAEARRRRQQGPLEALASLTAFGGQIAGRALLAAFGPTAAVALGDTLLGLFLDSRGPDRQDPITQELTAAERHLDELTTARRRVLHDMRRKVHILEGRLPHTHLSQEH